MPLRELVSVVILTKNEEERIARAIRSAHWADEILVLDSESTDRTQAIAKQEGATVFVQPWLGWIEQHARGQNLATHDWVFFIDADEIITSELAKSVLSVLAAQPDPRNGYYVNRRDEYLGRLMPNVRRRKLAPALVRLYNRRFSFWDPSMLIHERVQHPGAAIALGGELLHWRNHSIGQQIETFNRNADLEARAMSSSTVAGSPIIMAVKPILRFAWVYIWCGYWRLGTRGFIDAWTHAFSEFLRHAKLWEARHAPAVIDPPLDIYAPPDNIPPKFSEKNNVRDRAI